MLLKKKKETEEESSRYRSLWASDGKVRDAPGTSPKTISEISLDRLGVTMDDFNKMSREEKKIIYEYEYGKPDSSKIGFNTDHEGSELTGSPTLNIRKAGPRALKLVTTVITLAVAFAFLIGISSITSNTLKSGGTKYTATEDMAPSNTNSPIIEEASKLDVRIVEAQEYLRDSVLDYRETDDNQAYEEAIQNVDDFVENNLVSVMDWPEDIRNIAIERLIQLKKAGQSIKEDESSSAVSIFNAFLDAEEKLNEKFETAIKAIVERDKTT